MAYGCTRALFCAELRACHEYYEFVKDSVVSLMDWLETAMSKVKSTERVVEYKNHHDESTIIWYSEM